MSNPIPLAVCWLLLVLLTCWSSASIVTTRVVGVGDGRQQQHDTLRRIDPPISEPGDWKPIDYGHPMRDDPTLVYVPPVVDPVHYGIHSAEPLWPIRGSKLPQFHLPPEAMLAASSTEQRWRTRQASRLHIKTDVTTTPRTLFKPSQRTDRPDHHHHRLPQFHRHPVRSTAWKRYDHPSNQLIGRSPALGPPLPVVLPTFRPGVASIRPTSRPVVLPMSRPRIIPPTSSSSPTAGQHPSAANNQQQRLLAGRQRADLPPPANRYFSSNARSYESVIDDSANNGLLHYGVSHHSLNAGKADGIDRADDDIDGLLLNDKSSESLPPSPGNEKKDVNNETVSDQHQHQQRKRAKKPFFPFQFVIQSGYSKVRKYGNEIRESLSADF